MDDKLMEVVYSLSPADLDYSEWIMVGMALKTEGYPLTVWDDWSRNDDRYRSGDCEKHWESFNGTANPVRAGTIVQLAKSKGVYQPTGRLPGRVMGWDEPILTDGDEPIPPHKREPWEDLSLYLETLFESNEYVSFVVESYQDADGKWKPSSKGVYNRTAGDLIENLKHYHGDLGYTIGDWKKEAGAWIRFNPVDGSGVKNENITQFRFALVESDTLTVQEQLDLYRQLQLPIAALVSSAGKSVHAIVHIDAPDKAEYSRRVAFLYEYLNGHGVPIDVQNKNPSRLSRMPGVTRGDQVQRLLGVNIGRRSWADWKEWVDSENDDMPPILKLSDVLLNPPPLPDELIKGVLRRGHKMLISSDSKAGKSFLLINLALSIAAGRPWMGFEVNQGRVLYVNFEIGDASAIHRVIEIKNRLGLPDDVAENMEIWNLRGRACDLETFVPKLLRRISGRKLDAIIVDPIYKVIMGDENNASDMGKFCNQFDRICEAAHCCCIYAHHHTKGAQGGKKAMDRASGSGVFARDPDAQLDISQLAMTAEDREMLRPDGFPRALAWRLEGTLREFEGFDPVDFWFTYPTYQIDEGLKRFGVEGSQEAASMIAAQVRVATAEDKYVSAWYAISEETGSEWVTARQIADRVGCSPNTVNVWMKRQEDLFEAQFTKHGNAYKLINALPVWP